MKSKLSVIVVAAAAVLALPACGVLKKKQADPAASASEPLVATPTPVPAAPAAPAPVEVAVADESVPAPEDFEDEAFEKVSDKTYKAELAGLKKEIEAP